MDNQGLRQSFTYGYREYDYAVYPSANQEGKIAIHVFPNGAIQIDAPQHAGTAEIKKAVLKRARWISLHVTEAQDRLKHILPREYVSGESHYYLGRRYVLKVQHSTDAEAAVKLLRGQLHVSGPHITPGDVQSLLSKWYKSRAQIVFADRLKAVSDTLPWLHTLPALHMRAMKKQWGSCSKSGKILLNPSLVKAPKDCIDYVLTHELCHLQEHNHSPKFYRELEAVLPNWRSVKGRLDNMAEVILA